MKSPIFVSAFCLLAFFLSSCSKENLIIENARIKSSNTSSFTGRDTIHCDDENVFEYDLISALLNTEVLTIDTILKAEIGDSLFNWVSDQVFLADSIGFEAWYFQLFGENASSDFVDEMDNIQTFLEDNYSSIYYASLADSLVDDYIDDNRFDLVEKNILSASVLYTSTAWQIAKCNANNITVRGGKDDGYLCYFAQTDPPVCELLQGAGAFVVGAYVGQWIVDNISYKFDGWLQALLAFGAAYLVDKWDPLECHGVCDDCHHPEKITLRADYFNCRYSAAQWFGSFEFNEGFTYRVFVASGNFNGTTFDTRQGFPTLFDPNDQTFVVNVRTICDGQTYPTPVEGFSQTFNPELPPTPFSIRGAIIANHEDEFTYTSSTSFGGNLSNPTWDVSEGVNVISTGIEDGRYYIIVNFEEVTTPRAEITLTVYDDCSESNILAYFPPRLEHE